MRIFGITVLDPAAELTRVLQVRAVALKNFGPDVIRPGQPMSQLELALVPIYLFHRYQTEAAIKEIGGLDYRYNERGDGLADPAIVAPADQRKALATVLQTLSPDTLTLPESLLKILPPVPPGYPRTQESFPAQTRPDVRSDYCRGVRCGPYAAGASRSGACLQARAISYAGSGEPFAAFGAGGSFYDRCGTA